MSQSSRLLGFDCRYERNGDGVETMGSPGVLLEVHLQFMDAKVVGTLPVLELVLIEFAQCSRVIHFLDGFFTRAGLSVAVIPAELSAPLELRNLFEL